MSRGSRKILIWLPLAIPPIHLTCPYLTDNAGRLGPGCSALNLAEPGSDCSSPLRSIKGMLRAFLPGFILAAALAQAQQTTPAPDAKPLPDLPTLLERTRAHADASQELAKNYTCKMVVGADDLDSKGNNKGTHTD